MNTKKTTVNVGDLVYDAEFEIIGVVTDIEIAYPKQPYFTILWARSIFYLSGPNHAVIDYITSIEVEQHRRDYMLLSR